MCPISQSKHMSEMRNTAGNASMMDDSSDSSVFHGMWFYFSYSFFVARFILFLVHIFPMTHPPFTSLSRFFKHFPQKAFPTLS